MSWLALKAVVRPDVVVRAAESLLSLGASGTNEDHPELLLPAGDGPLLSGMPGEVAPAPPRPKSSVSVTGWFPGDAKPDDLVRRLALLLGAQAEISVERVDDQDWNATWKEGWTATRISPRLWVVPSWQQPPALMEGERALRLDPGMAFGTGTHETTAGCARLLDEALAGRVPEALLDVGTGTGVLALSALLLGVPYAVAVDVDPAAVEASRGNAVLNGLSERVELHTGTVDAVPRRRFGLVIANILPVVLVPLAPLLRDRLALGATLLLGGIREEKREEVEAAYAAIGLRVEQVIIDAGWHSLRLR